MEIVYSYVEVLLGVVHHVPVVDSHSVPSQLEVVVVILTANHATSRHRVRTRPAVLTQQEAMEKPQLGKSRWLRVFTKRLRLQSRIEEVREHGRANKEPDDTPVSFPWQSREPSENSSIKAKPLTAVDLVGRLRLPDATFHHATS
jgi:hypothetical protein